MSDGNTFSGPGRRRGSTLLIVLVALVPVCLAGWLLWGSAGGSSGDGAEPPSPLPPPTAEASSDAPPYGKRPPPDKDDSGAGDTDQGGSAGKDGGKDEGGDGGQGKDEGGGKPASGPLSGKVVVIDPGHNPGNKDHTNAIGRSVDIGTGRKDCDTTGTATNSGYSEAAFTLDVSRRIRTLLEARGATVKFTQDDDRPYGPCVTERAAIGNRARADAAVSVHADGSAAGNRGFHVILPGRVKAGKADTSPIVGPSRDLGERIAGSFVRATGSGPSNYIGDDSGLDVRSDLGGLNLSTVPKVFIECGNMRDAQDAGRLTDAKWRQRAAQGISDGIGTYLESTA